MKLAICNELFEDWNLQRVINFIADLGYDGLEIAPFTLADSVVDITPARRREIKKMAFDSGTAITGLHWLLVKPEGLHIAHPDQRIRERTIDYFRNLVDFCADIGGVNLVFGSPQQRNILPEVGWEKGRQYAMEAFTIVGEAAQARGVTLCLEALPSDLTNFLNTNSEVLAMVKEINHPHVQMMLDVKSMCAEAKPLPDNIRACQGFFRHVHANDANMKGPGFGETDFGPIFKTLQDLNYQGFVSVEVFDFNPDPETIALESLQYMKECLG